MMYKGANVGNVADNEEDENEENKENEEPKEKERTFSTPMMWARTIAKRHLFSFRVNLLMDGLL